jgi:hypothetical protein
MQNSHIQELRSKAKAERAEISMLRHKLSDAELKQLLDRATSWLDDVEGFLIPHAVKALPAHELMWLSHAEATLLMAIQRRKFVRQLVATHTPDQSTIGV